MVASGPLRAGYHWVITPATRANMGAVAPQSFSTCATADFVGPGCFVLPGMRLGRWCWHRPGKRLGDGWWVVRKPAEHRSIWVTGAVDGGVVVLEAVLTLSDGSSPPLTVEG